MDTLTRALERLAVEDPAAALELAEREGLGPETPELRSLLRLPLLDVNRALAKLDPGTFISRLSHRIYSIWDNRQYLVSELTSLVGTIEAGDSLRTQQYTMAPNVWYCFAEDQEGQVQEDEVFSEERVRVIRKIVARRHFATTDGRYIFDVETPYLMLNESQVELILGAKPDVYRAASPSQSASLIDRFYTSGRDYILLDALGRTYNATSQVGKLLGLAGSEDRVRRLFNYGYEVGSYLVVGLGSTLLTLLDEFGRAYSLSTRDQRMAARAYVEIAEELWLVNLRSQRLYLAQSSLDQVDLLTVEAEPSLSLSLEPLVSLLGTVEYGARMIDAGSGLDPIGSSRCEWKAACSLYRP